jgi:hypothetical protein
LQIRQIGGIKEFYVGLKWNLLGYCGKHAFRWGTMPMVNQFFERQTENRLLQATLTGTSYSLLEVLFSLKEGTFCSQSNTHSLISDFAVTSHRQRLSNVHRNQSKPRR